MKSKRATPVVVTIVPRTPTQPTWRIANHADKIGIVGFGSQAHAEALANRLNQHRAVNRYVAERLESASPEGIDIAAELAKHTGTRT